MATRAIFITGGGSGIGRAVARRFAAEGWRIGLADVNGAGMEETRRLIGGDAVSLHPLDVRDRAGWDAALGAFAAHGEGRLDVLFNNAGIAVGGSFADQPRADIDRCVAVNLTGVLYGAQAAHRWLKATPGSCLLNTASAAGIRGTAGAAVYSATKFGVRGLTEALDAEWAADGIRVRSLMPGFIDTPLLDAGVTGSNQSVRERVRAARLEFTPVETVAQAAWDAVHGERLHTPVGPTARRLAFLARWAPGLLRRKMRRSV